MPLEGLAPAALARKRSHGGRGMDRCPTCGEQIRGGAKFCTTCGTRLDAENGFAAVPPLEVNAVAHEQDQPNAANPGWPASPKPNDNETFAAWGAPRAEDPAVADETVSIWQSGGSAWPAPPASAAPAAPAAAAAEEDTAQAVETEIASLFVADPPEQDTAETGASQAQERALTLLDELRSAIASLGPGSPVDTSSVISDLEVAVTPPGAMAPDDLSQLRDALFAARDRPRDLDTIVDLTGRIDSLLALVIAYDRATAAIERSLKTLRQS